VTFVKCAAPSTADMRTRQSLISLTCKVAWRRGRRRLITACDMLTSRMLEGRESVDIDRHAFDFDNVTPSSTTGRAMVSGGGRGGGVEAVDDVVGVAVRDLKANFFFGSIFVFSVVINVPSSFSCYCK